MSSTNPLGPLIDRFPARPLMVPELIWLILLGVAGTLTPLIYGVYHQYYGYAKYGPVAAQAWSRPWYLLALFSLFAFTLLVFMRLRWALSYVDLHRDGLYISYARPQVLRWSNLAGVAVSAVRSQWLGRSSETQYQAILIPSTGRVIHLPGSIPNLPLLLTQIKAHLYPRLAPQLQSHFTAGQWLYFGAVSVHTQALRLGERSHRQVTIPWSDVQQLTVQSGHLVITLKNGHTHRLAVARIPNIEILLQIIQAGVST